MEDIQKQVAEIKENVGVALSQCSSILRRLEKLEGNPDETYAEVINLLGTFNKQELMIAKKLLEEIKNGK